MHQCASKHVCECTVCMCVDYRHPLWRRRVASWGMLGLPWRRTEHRRRSCEARHLPVFGAESNNIRVYTSWQHTLTTHKQTHTLTGRRPGQRPGRGQGQRPGQGQRVSRASAQNSPKIAVAVTQASPVTHAPVTQQETTTHGPHVVARLVVDPLQSL